MSRFDGFARQLAHLRAAVALLDSHPGLVAPAGVVVAAQVLAVVAAVGVVGAAGPVVPWLAVAVAWLGASVVPATGLLGATAAAARDAGQPTTDDATPATGDAAPGGAPPTDATAPLRLAAAAARRRGAPALAATAASAVVAAAVAAVVAAVASVPVTAVQATFYVATDGATGAAPVGAVVLFGGFGLAVATAVGALPVAFVPALVTLDGAAPGCAPRTSLRVALARPGALATHALVVVVLLAIPAGVALALAAAFDGATGPAAAVAAYAVLGAPAVALAAAHHAVVFERVVTPTLAAADEGELSRPPLVDDPARAALAALVLLGLVAGSAAVRGADLRPTPVATSPVDADAPPSAVVATARSLTRQVGHRRTVRRYETNATTGAERLEVTWRYAVDYRDRQARVTLRDASDGDVGRSYFEEGEIAADPIGGPPGLLSRSPLSRRAGDWAVAVAPGFPAVGDDFGVRSDEYPNAAADWRVVERRNGTVVYGAPYEMAGPEAFPSAEDGVVGPDSRVRVYVDRETGYLTRYELRWNVTATGPDGEVTDHYLGRRVVTLSDYDRTDVTRPEGLGRRSVLGVLWNLAYY